MRILVWHVHGGWMDSFVRGDHQYLLPSAPGSGAWARGRDGRPWPANAVDVPLRDLAAAEIDAVVLQRLDEIDLCERLTGRRPGRDLPALYLEHNTPREGVDQAVHPLAGQDAIPIVHVTHFNQLFWDNGRAPSVVIEHGIPDPGYSYTGEHRRLGFVINEPVRRWRRTGTDLLPRFAEAGPLEVYGIATEALPEAVGLGPERLAIRGDVAPEVLRARLPRTRVYVHPFRWTSLGLALLEAMQLGMPVVALDTTEAARAVPPEAGALSTSVGELVEACRRLLDDPDEARERGQLARAAALERYNLVRFLQDWDNVLEDAVATRRRVIGEGSAA